MRVRLLLDGEPSLGLAVNGVACPDDEWSTWIDWPWPVMPGWRDIICLADFVDGLTCNPAPGVATGEPYVFVDRVAYAAEGPCIQGGVRLVPV